MQYKQRTNLKPNENFEKDFLQERGIDNLEKFLRPTKKEQYSPWLLNNTKEGVELLVHHINNNSNIFIQVDSDTDGYCSAAMIYLYLKQVNPSLAIDWRVHNGKQHGVILDTIPENTNLVIIPDAGSNQNEDLNILIEKGIDVIVLDHHIVEDSIPTKAIIINNQNSEKYPNKSLSGAGVVYKFCQCLDEHYSHDFAEDLIDLTAVAIIGDMMELKDLETRYIISEGLSIVNNIGLSALFDAQSYSMGNKKTPISIAFYIVPLINALIRVGSQEEKEILFLALIEPGRQIPSTKRGAKEGDTESAAACAARICGNAKSRQQRIRDKAFELLDMKILKEGLDQHKIIVVQVTDEEEFDTTLTGLVAMQLTSKYKKPILVVRENSDGFLRGSARGLSNGPIEDLRQFFSDSGYFDYASGHAMAHGVSIHKSQLKEFIEYFDKAFENTEFNENTYEVDIIVEANNFYLNSIITFIGELSSIWGQGMEEPLIVIENIKLNKHDVQLIGNDKTTVKFVINGITYIKFKDEDLIEDLTKQDTMTVTILGKANLNEWRGSFTPQIFIEDYSIVDTTYEF